MAASNPLSEMLKYKQIIFFIWSIYHEKGPILQGFKGSKQTVKNIYIYTGISLTLYSDME